MKTALEEELSDALARRAASLPQGATDRLRTVDYHPRRHRHVLGVPVAVGAGAAAASAATVGTVLAVALGGAAPAYAGWSATPTLSSAPTTTAPDCVSTLVSAGAGPAGTGSATGTWQTLLSDVRGPFTVTLLQNGTSYATCFMGPSFTEVNRITSPSGTGGAQSGELSVSSQTANTGGSGGSKASSPPPGGVGSLVSLEGTSSGDLNQVLQNHLTTSADGPYTFIDGRVANGVTGTTLVLKDGQNIVATVADGWFVAWWPGSSDATSAQVTKASGTTSEPFVPVSQMGTKFPLGQAGSSSGVTLPPSPGTCTTTPPSSTPTTSGTSSTSGGPSVNCKATTSTGGGAPSSNKNSGTTGTTGTTGNTGNTGSSGPATKSSP
jgi:hypothetical protein